MSKTKELRGGSDYAWMEKALAVSEEEVLSMIRAERAKEAANPEPIETVDEKRLVAALMCMEAHFLKAPPMGPLTRKRYHNAFMASIPRLQDPKVR